MAAIGNDEACGHIERSGLTCTIRAKQTNYFALLHIVAHVVDHGALAIALDKSLGAQHEVFGRLGNGRFLFQIVDVFFHLANFVAKVQKKFKVQSSKFKVFS